MIRVGQKLAQVRQKKGLTLKDVEDATKIKSTFLSSIEKGEYQDLPSPAYAHGFVKNYAQFLGIPVREIMALFRREFDEKREFRVLPETITDAKEYSSFRFRVRRRILLSVFFLFLFIG